VGVTHQLKKLKLACRVPGSQLIKLCTGFHVPSPLPRFRLPGLLVALGPHFGPVAWPWLRQQPAHGPVLAEGRHVPGRGHVQVRGPVTHQQEEAGGPAERHGLREG